MLDNKSADCKELLEMQSMKSTHETSVAISLDEIQYNAIIALKTTNEVAHTFALKHN